MKKIIGGLFIIFLMVSVGYAQTRTDNKGNSSGGSASQTPPLPPTNPPVNDRGRGRSGGGSRGNCEPVTPCPACPSVQSCGCSAEIERLAYAIAHLHCENSAGHGFTSCLFGSETNEEREVCRRNYRNRIAECAAELSTERGGRSGSNDSNPASPVEPPPPIGPPGRR